MDKSRATSQCQNMAGSDRGFSPRVFGGVAPEATPQVGVWRAVGAFEADSSSFDPLRVRNDKGLAEVCRLGLAPATKAR
jgi:hypothetical protein